MANIKSCPTCGTAYFEGNKMCKCPPRLELQDSIADKKPSTRDRRHNYRTDAMPPQGTDKHVDKLK